MNYLKSEDWSVQLFHKKGVNMDCKRSWETFRNDVIKAV